MLGWSARLFPTAQAVVSPQPPGSGGLKESRHNVPLYILRRLREESF